jgi:hypothetical protein
MYHICAAASIRLLGRMLFETGAGAVFVALAKGIVGGSLRRYIGFHFGRCWGCIGFNSSICPLDALQVLAEILA